MPKKVDQISRTNLVTRINQVRKNLSDCMIHDDYTLRARLSELSARAKKNSSDPAIESSLTKIERVVAESINTCQARQALRPTIQYPEALPVSQKRALITDIIKGNQVVIIAGETGSGKTTQLAKICIDMGRGVRGLIGHTQPRRIAARSVAQQISKELNSELGDIVGYKVRFSDQTSRNGIVKLMTDGILLAEIQHDRLLLAYDTIIIDEAHERSQNIDFLLGFLKQLLPKRPDLKIIITSATIEHDKFSSHFNNAPVIEVIGRSFPIDIRYRPLGEGDDADASDDIISAVANGVAEAIHDGPGDILVFLSGEREIRDVAEILSDAKHRNCTVLPLFSRLSATDQKKIFTPHHGRNIILSTNVAETSLTIPGIKYVIDSGYVRISRYSHKSKVQRLPIEKISQASANQRAGRCGRVEPGICLRLYSEEDFLSRSEFTQPEILRSNLANVILNMRSMKIGDINDFPFIDAPEHKFITDGYQSLFELSAVDDARKITSIGRQIARFPIDVRLGRMIVEAEKEACLSDILIITAALSIQDPRERPAGKEKKADECHRVFIDEKSDFLAYLNIWKWFNDHQDNNSRSRLRKICKHNFISYIRMLEWADLHRQLISVIKKTMPKSLGNEADYGKIHRSILSGLLSHIATKQEKGVFLGARNSKLNIFPASGLFSKSPKWIMGYEIVETSKRYIRTVAFIDPGWIERLASHVLKSETYSPFWDQQHGTVTAYQTLSLYGIVISAGRKTNYSRVNIEDARRIFIADALVDGKISLPYAFYRDNDDFLTLISNMESKLRTSIADYDEAAIFDFYDSKIPPDVSDKKSFIKWVESNSDRVNKILTIAPDVTPVLNKYSHIDAVYPDHIDVRNNKFDLEYSFSPSMSVDGVTVVMPEILATTYSNDSFLFSVPGYRKDILTLMIKTLPKPIRKKLSPISSFVNECLDSGIDSSLLMTEVKKRIIKKAQCHAKDVVFSLHNVPHYMQCKFKIVDGENNVVKYGVNLDELSSSLEVKVTPPLNNIDRQRNNITSWDFSNLLEKVEALYGDKTITSYMALIDNDGSVTLKPVIDRDEALYLSKQGIRRLFMIMNKDRIKYMMKNIAGYSKMSLWFAAFHDTAPLKDYLIYRAIDVALGLDDMPPLTKEDYEQRCSGLSGSLPGESLLATFNQFCSITYRILEACGGMNNKIISVTDPVARDDLNNQLSLLTSPGFISKSPAEWFVHIPRYLDAMSIRIEKLAMNPSKDKTSLAMLQPVLKKFSSLDSSAEPAELKIGRYAEIFWLIQELRVSLFSQPLKTSRPISVKRIEKVIASYII